LQFCPTCWRSLRVVSEQIRSEGDGVISVMLLRCPNGHEWRWREGAERLQSGASVDQR